MARWWTRRLVFPALHHVQRDQPPGVPPLALTGERTLPDVPAENYWFRRHLVVYRWIADRCAGMDVVDMACGEGYGTDVLASRARRVTGVDANPEAHEHARAKYTRPGVRFARDLIETYIEPCDALVFLQTIEHVREPEQVLRHFKAMAETVYVSTPNLLTLAPPGVGITKPFYDRFTPAISARDFALRPEPLDRALDFVAVLS